MLILGILQPCGRNKYKSVVDHSVLLLVPFMLYMCCMFCTGEGASCIFTGEVFKNRLLLLKKHVDENESLQLEILHACQVAVTKLKHPPSKKDSWKKKTKLSMLVNDSSL